jgi:hypothetical protein
MLSSTLSPPYFKLLGRVPAWLPRSETSGRVARSQKMDESRRTLRSPLERGGGKVSPLRLEMNRQNEPHSGLASDENLRRRAPRSSGPTGARFEPGHIPLHPTNRRRSEMELRTGEDLGCFHLPKGRAQNLETPY